MKRWIAIVLALVLTVSMLPSVFAVQPSDYADTRDIWEVITEIEDSAVENLRTTSIDVRTAAYSASVDRIIEAVVNSSDYVPGSLERHGNFFFWIDANGDPNGYSPSLRARQRAGAVPGADAEDFAAVETVSYAVRGGNPSSMDVAAFQPYIGIDSSFTAQYEIRCNAIAQATGGTGTTYKTTQANINNIGLALSTCGVVIFDSHGTTDYDNGSYYNPDYTSRANSSYLCLTSGTGITAEDKQSAQGEFGTYYHAFNSGGTWCIDGTAMQNHMTSDSPNGMLWMAICLGMATSGLQEPLRNRGMEVVYGYSQSVSFTGDYKYEGYFWPYMCEGHNVAESAAYMKAKFANMDTYTNPRAYPIFVSSEDVYPGHGNVDKVQTVYSTWTLFQQYEITAVSNNTDWGTVKLQGDKITATPNSGYYTDDYEVLEGTAQVTREGNVFTVEPETDCTIQINFAPRDPAVIHFSVPEGVACADIDAFVGDEITMPTPDGEPTAEGYEYRFLGWVTSPMDADSMLLPDYLNAGSKLKVSGTDLTYYALYTYFVAIDGLNDDQFVRVDDAKQSWAGEYVITYQGVYGLSAEKTYSGTKIATKNAVVDLAATGCVYEGKILSGVTEDITYVIAPSENGTYTVKKKGVNHYLAMATDSDSLTTYTSSNTDKSRWIITFGDKGITLTNAEYSGRSLQFDAGNSYFKCFGSAKQPLTLFAKADGDNWYTTDPQDKVVCEEHSFGDWTTETEPSCTEPGNMVRICTVCGFKETQSIDALGHTPGEPERENEKEATCTEEGSYDEVVYCTACGSELSRETVTVEKLPHTPGEPVQENVVGATCTEAGSYDEVVYCTVCGTELSRGHHEGEVLGHDYVAVVTAPTCTEKGYTTYTCSRCGDTYVSDETEALGHTAGEAVKENEKAPTCTDNGSYELVVKCTVCGEELSRTQNSVDALGHDWGEWTVTTAATCTEAGEEARTCGRCDETETRSIKAPGHTPGEAVKENETAATCTKKGSYDLVVYCTVCGEKLNSTHNTTKKLGHNWDEGVVMVQPTYTEAGLMMFTCLRCGEARTEAIPVLVHDCPCKMFVDMPELGTVEHAAIDWAYIAKPQITNGMDATHFEPSGVVTRGQAVTFLWRAAGKPAPKTTESPFVDVQNPKAFYYKAVLWAVENGITNGMDATHFEPNGKLTKAYMLTFLYRQQGSPKVKTTASYSDMTQKWYKKAISWAVENGIEAPKSASAFGVNDACLRSRTVVYLYRTLTRQMLEQ